MVHYYSPDRPPVLGLATLDDAVSAPAIFAITPKNLHPPQYVEVSVCEEKRGVRECVLVECFGDVGGGGGRMCYWGM